MLSCRKTYIFISVWRTIRMLRCSCLLVALALFVATPMLTASSYTVVNQSGQSLSSLFEGLKPSPFAKPDLLWKYRPTGRNWNGALSNHLPGLLPVQHIIGGDSCPSTEVCSGNFTVIEASGGCLDCVGHNFATDFVNGTCFTGEQNSYCGDNCCVDAQDCFNRFGCGR